MQFMLYALRDGDKYCHHISMHLYDMLGAKEKQQHYYAFRIQIKYGDDIAYKF